VQIKIFVARASYQVLEYSTGARMNCAYRVVKNKWIPGFLFKLVV